MRFRCTASDNQLQSIAGLVSSCQSVSEGIPPLRVALGFSKPPIFLHGEDVPSMHGGFRSAMLFVDAQGATIDPETILDETAFEDTKSEEEIQEKSSSSKTEVKGGLKNGILAVVTLGLSIALSKEANSLGKLHTAKPRSYPVKRIKATVPGVWEFHGVDNVDGILSGQYLGKSDLCSLNDNMEDEEVTIFVSLNVFAGDFELVGPEEGAKTAVEKIIVAKEILGDLYQQNNPSTISRMILEGVKSDAPPIDGDILKERDDAR